MELVAIQEAQECEITSREITDAGKTLVYQFLFCEETEAWDSGSKANALMNPPPRFKHRQDKVGRC